MDILYSLILLVTAAVILTTAEPNNKAVKIGQNAELEYDFGEAPPDDRKWKKGATSPVDVADENTGTGNEKYDEAVTENVWKLTIKNVDKNDGELYTCSSATASKSASANLVVLGTPTCELADEATDKIKFTCEIDHGGNLVPELQLEQSDLSLDIMGGSPSGGNVSHNADVTASDADGKTFSCSVTFEGITLPNTPSGIDETTKPNFAETCTVQAAVPAGISISSAGGNTTLVESDVLTCTVTTAGNPQGNFKWTDEDDTDISTEANYTVSASLAGKSVTCTASNNIGSTSATFPASTDTDTTTVTGAEFTTNQSSGASINQVAVLPLLFAVIYNMILLM